MGANLTAMTNQNPHTIAVIGGDGIGPEVTAEALKVLRALGGEQSFEFVEHDLGAEQGDGTGDSAVHQRHGRLRSSGAAQVRSC